MREFATPTRTGENAEAVANKAARRLALLVCRYMLMIMVRNNQPDDCYVLSLRL